MAAPTVAAIVPVRNRPGLVLEALSSVAAQTRRPDRLVVVDDGSTDDTAERVAAWQAEHFGELVRGDSSGASAARNRGVAEAAGCDLVAFLDSDDTWPADYLARTTAAFASRPDAVAACTDQLRTEFRKGNKTTLRRFDDIPERATAYLLEHGPTGTCSTVLSAAAFREVGGFESPMQYGEDFLLYLRLSVRGAWLHVPGEPVAYRVGIGETVGETGSLSLAHAERRLTWARIMERFLVEEGGAEALPAAVWRHHLGRAWFKAGQELQAAGDRERARASLDRAVELRPWWPRPRLRRMLV